MTSSPTQAQTRRVLTPTEKVLTASLVFAPVLYLIADSTYAARGWTDSTAGILHVLGAISYGFVVLRVTTWLDARPLLGVAILITGLIGMAGNVAYGFDTIHMSLGDTALVHQPGAANLIKPLGLFVPLSFVLVAFAVFLLGHRWQGVVLLVAALAWPVAHIGNIAPLAVAVNVLLVVGFGSLAWRERTGGSLGAASSSSSESSGE